MPLYHASAYDTTQTVPSYWEASAPPLAFSPDRCVGRTDCDVAIVGGGYTGLSAALALARDHGMHAVVLEAGSLGWGASGRNGGFCSAGAAKLPYGAMIRRYGLDDTRAFHDALRASVEHVRGFLSRHGVDAQATRGGDLRLAHSASRINALRAEADFMNATFGLDQRFLARGELAERGYHGLQFHAGLLDPEAFGLHPLRYLRGLAEAARTAGATLFAHSAVIDWRREGKGHLLKT
ncbi:MAG: FAD-dependent oxidoreductase, partial [Pseudomonadota bacterium]|nr:FAD-dependent oxidoreductase [Pseudomonadota bacterium]